MRKLILTIMVLLVPAAARGDVTQTWVNILDPVANGGNAVDTTGVSDSAAGIQAAIDYMFAHNATAVYCPAGNYRHDETIWLDPPNNMRAQSWAGTGYITSGVLTISTTTSGSFGGQGTYIKGPGVPGATIVASGGGPYALNNSFSAGSSGSHIALTAFAPYSASQFQFSASFFGDPSGGNIGSGGVQGCQLHPNFNNAPALMVGTGQGMRVSDVSVIGACCGYRGALPAQGIGVGLNGGSGGSSDNLVENVTVANFRNCFVAGANGLISNRDLPLDDSNTWRKTSTGNCYAALKLWGTQTFIDDVIEPHWFGVTIGVDDLPAHQVSIYGGNISAGEALHKTFSWTGVAYHGSCPDGSTTLCIDAAITSPDADILAGLYDSFVAVTTTHGAVPLKLISIDGSGNAVLGIWQPWYAQNYGRLASDGTSSALIAAIGAEGTVYATERVRVARGYGFIMEGVHIENYDACTTLLDTTSTWGGQVSNLLRNIYFNVSDISIGGSDVQTQDCQKSFPMIGSDAAGISGVPPAATLIQGGNWGQTTDPINIDLYYTDNIRGELLDNTRLNVRVWDANDAYSYGQIAQPRWANPGTVPQYQLATVARGGGWWDNDYFRAASVISPAMQFQLSGELTSPFCGFEPCPYTTPNMSPALYALVSGTLGDLGTYPLVACRTVYKSLDWNTTTPAGSKLWLRSASCPGWSYGQNLTDALVGGTVTYHGTSGSSVIYLDTKTLGWMRSGLTIALGSDKYTVTGVYPGLGYVTVIAAATDAGGLLSTNYSCASSCTIGQAPYSWTTY